MADSLIEAKKRGVKKITLVRTDDGRIKAAVVDDGK